MLEGAQGRRFTVEEANAELDRLRELLPALQEARRKLLEGSERIRSVAGRNGGGRGGAERLEAAATIRRGVEELAEAGIVLRDADTGLVDFPSEREGRQVFLCWRLGEDAVAHWHEVDAGLGGRKPL